MRIVYLFIFALVFTSSLPAQTEVASEAARFAQESLFLAKQERYEAALEKIETAVALDPKNVEYLNRQADLTVLQALYVMNPAMTRMGYDSPDSYPKVERESMRTALEIADRALETIRSIPGGYACEAINQRTVRDLTSLREKFVALTVLQHPGLKNEVDRFNRAVLEHWDRENYGIVVKNVRDENSFEKFARFVSTGLETVKHQPESAATAMYEKIIGDFVRFAKQWPPVKDADKAVRRLGRDFADFAAAYRTSRDGILSGIDGTKTVRGVDASLERSYKMLDSGPQPVFAIYGWLARNKVDTRVSPKNEDHEWSKLKMENLKIKLNSLPPKLKPEDYTILYEEATVLGYYGKGNESIRDCIGIIETANNRGEFSGRLVREAVFRLGNSECRSEFKDEIPRYVKIFEKQILQASQIDVRQKNELEALLAGQNFLGTQKTGTKPWSEEIRINSTFQRALLHGNTLYLFIVEEGPNLRLDEFDLKTRQYTKGKSLPCKLNWPMYYPPTDRYDAACVDDHNVYYGSYGAGILVFPRNGTTPWTLNVEDGLPSDFVQAIGILNGKLYAGLGEERKGSWLVAVDLKTRNCEILASSNAKEGKFPFCNLSPAPRYGLLFTDTKRNRLLMAVEANGHKNLGGLWTLDGKSGEIVRTYPFAFNSVGDGQLLPDGDRFRLMTSGANFLINLADSGAGANAVELISCPNKEYREGEAWKLLTPKIPSVWMTRGTIWNGYLWGCLYCKDESERKKFGGETYWARITLDGTSGPERLRLPHGASEDTWNPWTPREVCLPTSDGKGLIVGNRYQLYLLRFE